MNINKTIETENGTIVFKGELNEDEVDFVIECGLVYMVQNDLLPFKQVSNDSDTTFMPQMKGTLQ